VLSLPFGNPPTNALNTPASMEPTGQPFKLRIYAARTMDKDFESVNSSTESAIFAPVNKEDKSAAPTTTVPPNADLTIKNTLLDRPSRLPMVATNAPVWPTDKCLAPAVPANAQGMDSLTESANRSPPVMDATHASATKTDKSLAQTGPADAQRMASPTELVNPLQEVVTLVNAPNLVPSVVQTGLVDVNTTDAWSPWVRA